MGGPSPCPVEASTTASTPHNCHQYNDPIARFFPLISADNCLTKTLGMLHFELRILGLLRVRAGHLSSLFHPSGKPWQPQTHPIATNHVHWSAQLHRSWNSQTESSKFLNVDIPVGTYQINSEHSHSRLTSKTNNTEC